MKAEILQEELTQKLLICTRFASTRVQLPVLANVYLEATGNKLIIAATNLEISICFSIGAKVEEEGKVTVPAKNLHELISNLSKGTLSISSEKEQLTITQEGFLGTLMGMNAMDFPQIPKEIKNVTTTLDSQIIKNACDKVLFSVSTDDTRPVLNGVLFVFDKDTLSLVSTDGFRLSQKTITLKSSNLSEKIIVPRSTINELSRVFQGSDIDISIDTNEKQIIFSDGTGVLSSRLIDGEFPNFERILPKSTTIEIDVSKDELNQAIKLASVFAKDSSNVIKCIISTDQLKVKAESSTAGRQEKTVSAKVKKEEKEDIVVAFNFHFLEELIHVINSESLLLKLSSGNSAVLFVDPKDESFLHVIMPIKLSE